MAFFDKPASKGSTMQTSRDRRFRILPAALIFIPVLVAFLIGCQDREEPEAPAKDPRGFRFLNMGAETPFSNGLRSRLKKKLGSDAFSRRATIDLTIENPDLFKEHFKTLYEINEALNHPLGERTEHDTLTLAYRYAKRAGSPFDMVELVFSDHTRLPLYFRIEPGEEARAIVDQLREKYGEPEVITLEEKDSRALFWTQKKDVMIASILQNRYGDLEYKIMIYFVDSLEALIQGEERIARQREEEKRKAGKRAF